MCQAAGSGMAMVFGDNFIFPDPLKLCFFGAIEIMFMVQCFENPSYQLPWSMIHDSIFSCGFAIIFSILILGSLKN